MILVGFTPLGKCHGDGGYESRHPQHAALSCRRPECRNTAPGRRRPTPDMGAAGRGNQRLIGGPAAGMAPILAWEAVADGDVSNSLRSAVPFVRDYLPRFGSPTFLPK